MDFDTGSSDLFLPSANCNSSCSGHKPYNASASCSSCDLNKTFELDYGDGSSTRGEQYTDTVIISDQIVRGRHFLLCCSSLLRALYTPHYQANFQTLGAATVYSGFEIDRFLPDGLMGMAYQSISVFNAPPLFQTLVSQNEEMAPIFAFKLARSGSELFIGGVNSSLYEGDFTWVNLTNKVFYPHEINCVYLANACLGLLAGAH